jgi:hypothetical protein
MQSAWIICGQSHALRTVPTAQTPVESTFTEVGLTCAREDPQQCTVTARLDAADSGFHEYSFIFLPESNIELLAG